MTVFIKDVVRNLSTTSGGLIQVLLSTGNFSALKTQYRGLQGSQYATNGANAAHDRYGFPAANIPGTLILQATDWSKKVRVTSLLNNTSVVEETNQYLRVYREISNFSYTQEKKYKVPINPPAITSFVNSGSNGYPYTTKWGTGGPFVIWWLLWTGSGGQKGLLIDWASYGGQSNGELDKNAFSGSPRVSGIQQFHSLSGSWNSTYGIEVHDEDDMTFYIKDIGEAPVKSTEQLTKAPEVIRSANTIQGTQSIRFVESRSGAYAAQQPGKDAYNILPGSNQGTTSFRWSNIDYNYGGSWFPLAVSADDYERLVILKDKTSYPAQPSKIGSTTLTTSNWVKNNINFSNDAAKGANNWWVANPVSSSGSTVYIKPIVVDGQLISQAYPKTGDVGPYASGRDSTWIGNSLDPSDYWYVLPLVKRAQTGGCCINLVSQTPNTTALQAVSVFTNEAVGNTCNFGMHFGKFLKSAFNSNDLYTWVNFIEAAGKQSATTVSVTTLFTGYRQSGAYRTGADMYSATYTPVVFSLRGIPEFVGYSGPVTIGGGATSPTTAPALDPDDTEIRNTLNAALSTKAVNLWTVTSIQTFAKTQATAIGRPLYDIKSELIRLFFEAKVKWYMNDKNLSYAKAMSAAANDPVYKALAGMFATTSSGTSGGGTATGSTPTAATGASVGAGTSASSNQTKTIRITVTRGLPGYKPGIRQTALTADRPELVQTYEYLELLPDGSYAGRAAPPRRFQFPFVPREVNYSGLGAQWTEIERTGSFPIVDWQSFQLLKISFNFDIVDRTLENQTGFGLFWSCEDQIRTLREMAQAPYPVTFLNMDQFMSEEIRYPLFTRGRGIEFVISEFTVTAVQRTPAQAASISGQLTPNQISRATASMTLQEIPIETVDIVQMPPIRPCVKLQKKCDKPPAAPPPGERSYVLFTPSVSL